MSPCRTAWPLETDGSTAATPQPGHTTGVSPGRPSHRSLRIAGRWFATLLMALLLGAAAIDAMGHPSYRVRPDHPRLLISDVRELARRCEGPLAEDYRVVKQRADAAVQRDGIEFISNAWSIPEDLMNCGIAYLVERELGRDHRKYADVIERQWGDGALIANPQGSHFGYHALAYDWIYNALPRERDHIVAFEHNRDYTYAAADITQGYSAAKAREVTRQFLYLRGGREFFVVFDRVEATRAEFRRHFFLHVPTKPETNGQVLNWFSLPEADGDRQVLSQGRSRLFLRTVLPAHAEIMTRGGPGQDAWGHPLEPTAQYNHPTEGRRRPPICPWRIEVGDPGSGPRSLFLHVFEITDEAVHEPTDVTFVPPAGLAIGNRWRVRFNPTGPLGGRVGDRDLAATIETATKYETRK